MEIRDINGAEVSRWGLGTKRFPTQDRAKVVNLDEDLARDNIEAALAAGANFFDTSYSNHKGVAEAHLGAMLGEGGALVGADFKTHNGQRTYVQTSFFEMVDPRYEYVFQKQLKKLQRPCVDFYHIEGVTDINRRLNIDNGAIDFLFGEKEAGRISQLGFSSELTAANLREHLAAYPWDYVRLRVNFFDWFERGLREQYDVIMEAGLPIVAHGALRMGNVAHLKRAAMAVLKEVAPQRGEVEWGLLFAKSIPGVSTVTCNCFSEAQIKEDAGYFAGDAILSPAEMDALEAACAEQKKVERK